MNDLRFAIRQLFKAPAFSTLAVLTLAISIGMNTAIFTLVHELFLRGLPFAEPQRIIHVYQEDKSRNIDQGPTSVPKFWHYRDAQNVFSEFAADAGTGFILTGLGEPIQINGDNVTANYFQTLGVKPIIGRLFLPEEEMKADVAVISEHFWKSKLAGDPYVLGRNITLNGVPTTIIGVVPTMPISWFGPDLEVWTVKPFELAGTPKELLMRGVSFLRGIGRLKPGVTLEQAKANLTAVAQSYAAANAEKADASWRPQLVPVPEDVTGQLRPAFITLLAAVGVVLLIACSNVANLLLVRFTGRKREIALRVALGASRSGIVRLFVVESTLLSIMAGVLGICIALWVLPLAPKLAGQNVPLSNVSALNLPVLGFTLLLSLLTGAVMGAYPALQSSKSDLIEGLKEGGRGTAGSAAQQRFRRVLVGAQVCLSVVLLAGAALLVTSFMRLAKENTGFRVDRIWNCGIGLPPSRYPDRQAYGRFAKRLQEELQTSPGVEAAAIAVDVPLGGGFSRTPYSRADGNVVPLNQRPLGLNHSVSPGYLKLFGIPLLSGRDFDDRDDLNSPPVVLISQATAKRLFPGEDPIGHQMLFGTDNGTGLVAQIVGIVGDIRFRQLDKADDVEFYRPIQQRIFPFLAVSVRSALRPDAIAATTRAALNRIDPELPIIQPATMDEVLSNSLGQQRMTTTLLGVFAGVALLLAMIGIYGAVGYTVAQRTGEIAVRMALGAQAGDVLRMIVRQGMTPVVIGLVVGLLSAFALGRLLGTQLYQVSPHNPVLLATTALLLVIVALIACLFPARRATLVNPMQALRAE
jgi:putative ABC transport system permease protein